MNKRNCECCKGEYAIGKSYGDYWCELLNPKVEVRGLCEFCNKESKWFLEKSLHESTQSSESNS